MTSLFIDRRATELEYESGAIIFRNKGERIGTIPIAPLTRVFLRGDVKLSASLLGKLGEQGVGVIVLSGRGKAPSLLLARPHNDAKRRVAQIKYTFDKKFCLDFAKELITEKIEQQINWFDMLRNSDMHIRYELTHTIRLLKPLMHKIKAANDIPQLRGLEGSAARIYFGGLKAVVPNSLGFTHRNRRPPRDPFNALLSLTYTLIHGETAIALFGAGLDPYIGFYHEVDFGRESLAADLVEPLRPIADRFCLNLVRKQDLKNEHFSTNKKRSLLNKAGRKIFYQNYESQTEPLRAEIQNLVDRTAQKISKNNPKKAKQFEEMSSKK